ncbi:MAG: indole-3-glycerol phosphate synthase TrpC [Proteobacteria bacterium]|nr:indole-3-glycerol phosphate synthase TrpC [Pseudomonadota bacterium]MDA1355791.1 indole-3-glycerol phosphate synthase TrpC [Pseudomonadota bacterium]
MSDILAQICADKREHIARCKQQQSLGVLETAAKAAAAPRGFAAALTRASKNGGLALIAELKKASPSKGLIRSDFDPKTLARAYESGDACCLSVLTDKPYFDGEDIFLTQARAAVVIPVLRKDFMLDPYQIVEARALGSDCILLIMAALSNSQAAELKSTAETLGMDVLVEVHDAAELARAAELGAALIGINNRNLKTLAVDLATTEQLLPGVPAGCDVVCESGLNSHADLKRMAKLGVTRFLVGESLMRQADVALATRLLLTGESGVEGRV